MGSHAEKVHVALSAEIIVWVERGHSRGKTTIRAFYNESCAKHRSLKVLWNSETLLGWNSTSHQLSFTSSASPSSLPAMNSQSGSVSICAVLQWKCKHIFYNEHMGDSSWKEFRFYPKHVIGQDCREAGSRRNQEAWRQERKDVYFKLVSVVAFLIFTISLSFRGPGPYIRAGECRGGGLFVRIVCALEFQYKYQYLNFFIIKVKHSKVEIYA